MDGKHSSLCGLQSVVMAQKKLTVFFSWQSDLDPKTNRFAIRNCLKKICQKHGLSYDEATKDRCGSPDIARTIEEKIKSADIFVADISIINADFQAKPTPNPNVLFELGIAQATLGWDRIILLANTAYANMEALPFDINKHRAMSYKLAPQDIQNLTSKQWLLSLQSNLETGIRSIINNNPLKEALKGDQTPKIQHERDCVKLRDLLDIFFFDDLKDFCEDGPRQINKYMYLFQKRLNQEVKNPSFLFYDKEIEALLRNIKDTINKCIPAGAPYRFNSNQTALVWDIPFDVFPSKEDEKLFLSAAAACSKLDGLINQLTRIVHERFIEINLDVKEGLNNDFFEEVYPSSKRESKL